MLAWLFTYLSYLVLHGDDDGDGDGDGDDDVLGGGEASTPRLLGRHYCQSIHHVWCRMRRTELLQEDQQPVVEGLSI